MSRARVRTTTSDANITERRWLPIDIDPRRPSDISASEAEREAAVGYGTSAAVEILIDVQRLSAPRTPVT